ncbi:MAG: hypothetical protein Q9204_007092 [Flavoplaca sp. TL-2023a]
MDGANHRNTVDWPTSHNLLFLTPKYRLPVLNKGKRLLNFQALQHLEESNILKLLRSSDLIKVNDSHSPSNEQILDLWQGLHLRHPSERSAPSNFFSIRSYLKGSGDWLGQVNSGSSRNDSTSILTNPEGSATSDGNSCALGPANNTHTNNSNGDKSTSAPADSQPNTAIDGNSSAPGLDNSQMNVESAGNDSTLDAADSQPNPSSDRNLDQPKELIRRTRSMGIPEVNVSKNNGLPAIWLLMEAHFRWPPVSGHKAEFCWNARREDVVGQKQPAVLAVNDGDRPIPGLAVKTELMKRAWDSRLKHFYWTVAFEGRYYIAIVERDEVRRLVSAQGKWDFHPIAFLPEAAPTHQWTSKFFLSKASRDAITEKKKTLPDSTPETIQQQLDSQLIPTQYASADKSPHGQTTGRKDHTKPQKRGRADSSNLQDGGGKEDSVLSEEGVSCSMPPLKIRRQGNRRVSFARQDAVAGEEDLDDAQDNRPDKQRDETLNDKLNEYKEERERLLRQAAAPQGARPSVQFNALVPRQALKNKRHERMLAQKEVELLEQQVKKEDAQKAAREQRTKQRHLRSDRDLRLAQARAIVLEAEEIEERMNEAGEKTMEHEDEVDECDHMIDVLKAEIGAIKTG